MAETEVYSNSSAADPADGTGSPGDPQWGPYGAPYSVALYAIGIPLALGIIFGNIFVIVVLKLTHRNEKQETCAFKVKTMTVLASIGCGEVLGGLVLLVNVLSLSAYTRLALLSVLCYYWLALQLLPALSAALHLTLLGVERYISVCYPANYPCMRKILAIIAVLWVYTLVAGLLALAFTVGHPRPMLCDVVTMPESYVIFIFLHVIICFVLVTYFFLSIRGTLKDHHRKIQVSNTITYNNLVEDARTSRLFYASLCIHVLCWLPFIVAEVTRLVGPVHRWYSTSTAIWWTFLFGHLSYLKFLWLVAWSGAFRADIASACGHKQKRPVRMSTIVRDG